MVSTQGVDSRVIQGQPASCQKSTFIQPIIQPKTHFMGLIGLPASQCKQDFPCIYFA